jgi:NAD(P)-dependent dehydrogenase (short-subunit alcohol dehydrogenase family)
MINTNNSTDKKVVLVTGASSGIGRQIALDLSLSDYSVYLQGRDTERLMGTLQEMKNPDLHKVLEWDLLDFDSYDKNLADLPYLDGVVHSAGISSKLTLLPFVKLDNLRKIQDTNLNSIIIILSKLWKLKKFNKNGSIVLLSSASADNGVVGTLAYAVSKGAINSAVKVLASEFATKNIRVNAISPGMVKTPMQETFASSMGSETLEKDIANYLFGYGETKDVSNLVKFLLSEESKWITGSIMKIDGGYKCK